MTEDEVVKLAEAVAAQRLVVESFGIMNTPSTAKDRVRMDAQYMVARDKLSLLEGSYQGALRLWANKLATSYSQPDRKVGNEGEKA